MPRSTGSCRSRPEAAACLNVKESTLGVLDEGRVDHQWFPSLHVLGAEDVHKVFAGNAVGLVDHSTLVLESAHHARLVHSSALSALEVAETDLKGEQVSEDILDCLVCFLEEDVPDFAGDWSV